MCIWRCWLQYRGSPLGRLRRCPPPSWPSSAPSRRRWRAGPAWRGWPSRSSPTAPSSTRPPAPVPGRRFRIKTPRKRSDFEASTSGTYVVVLVEVGLFDFLPLKRAAVGQDVNDGLLVGPWRQHNTSLMNTSKFMRLQNVFNAPKPLQALRIALMSAMTSKSS